jgi:hypothetical protein
MFRKALKTILVKEKEFLFPGPDGMRTYDLRVVPELGEAGEGVVADVLQHLSACSCLLGGGVVSGCWVYGSSLVPYC